MLYQQMCQDTFIQEVAYPDGFNKSAHVVQFLEEKSKKFNLLSVFCMSFKEKSTT